MFVQRHLNTPSINMVLIKIHFIKLKKCYEKKLIINAITVLTGSPVRHLMTKELVFSEFGEPPRVLKMRQGNLPACLHPDDVLVRMLAAPINPADLNTIEGTYPVKLSMPCVAGNEGVGVVQDVGRNVTSCLPGNRVVITTPAQGTWRDYAVFQKSMLKVVPSYLKIAEAATLTINPCTAYRLLTDFIPVRNTGVVVIQNGANSACGQNVIQLCKVWGVKTINIVRKRNTITALKKYLEDLGATYVLTEEELQTTTLFKGQLIDKPSLALNCVGGKSALLLMKHLDYNGCMVTYGGMSKLPVTIPTSAFIFKNLSFYGFWITAWNKKSDELEKDKMLTEIISMMINKKLKAASHQLVKFDKFDSAVRNTLTGFQGNKYILDFC